MPDDIAALPAHGHVRGGKRLIGPAALHRGSELLAVDQANRDRRGVGSHVEARLSAGYDDGAMQARELERARQLGRPGAGDDEFASVVGHDQVTRAELGDRRVRELLPEEAFILWANEGPDTARVARTLAVLRRRGPFVALVNPDREFLRLIDRRALLEEVVKQMEE